MIVTLTGKGGAGKTSLCALLLDELARCDEPGPVLAVDADPATTLHLALGLPEPEATVAAVRDETPLTAQVVRRLPPGDSVGDYVRRQLQAAGVIRTHLMQQLPVDLLAMGQGEGPGCYCNINRALAGALAQIVAGYRLVLVDNEAGVEHLSRYRLPQADLLAVVVTPGQAAQAVGRRIVATARQVGLATGATWTIYNQAPGDYRPPDDCHPAGDYRPPGDCCHPVGDYHPAGDEVAMNLIIPASAGLVALEQQGQPAINLPAADPLRAALRPLVEAIRREAIRRETMGREAI